MKIQYIGFITGVFLFSTLWAAPPVATDGPQAVAHPAQVKKVNDPVDGGWLPDIVGLPNPDEIESLTEHVEQVMAEEQDKKCNAIDYNLRMLVFQNFVIYQHMANAQHIYFTEKLAQKYAHILAMTLKESSGDPTNITDMKGRSVSTSTPGASLQHWKDLLKLSLQHRIQLNFQTNFGLTQLSTDRLYVAFKLAHGADHTKDFLEGKSGDATPNRVALDTAIAIRRVIWLYQDFAQGRLTQKEQRIHQKDIFKHEFNERYQLGLKMALLYCGTRYLFHADNQQTWLNEYSNFESTMASIAYCKLGNPKTGYGRNKVDARCFAEWVTLCPALNINLALLTPLEYFQTKGENPVCLSTFERLLVQPPGKP